MKHLLRNLWIAALIVCCNFQQVSAQQLPPIPIDQDVRIGKLDNGLTYYIRKNSLPANRADFYIAQKVGSIQEEDNQRGLAHFLEHMCFNGTTHFPGKSLIQYLERIGVKFGENLNAYTSIDETVYNISNVPVNTPGAIDSCLLILHDWSNDLTLDPKEIDKERGVINEEWRTRMSAMQRFQEKMLPAMFAGTKYANCFPIGTMDVVMNFKPQTLRDYYEKWYRPDLQGIMVVGDVDVDATEALIKKMFADIPAQPNGAKREYYPVNDNKEPIILVARDKEQPYVQTFIFNKHETTPREEKSNVGYLMQDYAATLITNMLNARLNELLQAANPPYIYAATYDDDFFVAKTKDAFTGIVVCKEDAIENGISTVLREMIEHSMISKSIERAQKKVEENNFGIRKRLLEYDDVMNKQRTVVYTKRRHALMGERIGMDIVNMIWDRCVNAIEAPTYEDCKMDLLQTLAMETPFTEEEFRNEKKEKLADKAFDAAMELFKRKTERMAQIAYPVIKQVYENQGHMYENILIPITDGKRMYNISCNLKAAYESECKEVVKAFEKSILLHVIDEAWKENLRELDDLKHSVQNASYEQKDPLLIYKLESVNLRLTAAIRS